ncbi:MAG: cysteine--tRNA ligase [bacterium]|nr:cysteine--tRNA ligase [bacterium]
MKIYNTASRSIEKFKPIEDKKILFYHCGPTVYWVQHIGNLRAMVWADIIRRSLIYSGFEVNFVRNYTDVGHLTSDQDIGEDKMEKGAKREGLTPDQIADKYIKIFEEDTKLLNIIPPNHKPRATEYISQMITMIQDLLNKHYAYITSQAIVYDISKFKNYNNLNHQKLEENIKGSGKGTVEDSEKKHFADFNLWVFKKGVHENALQTWPSPWGDGFPGWHIECSVMAKTLLGETIDIHMGGVEHIAIHHTNEIAQSEAANNKEFVHYWLHNEHLDVNGRKMAKSEGTGFTLEQIKEKGFDPMTLRYFFLSAHYRSKQNFTWEALNASSEAYKKLKQFILIYKKQTERSELSTEKLNQIDKYRNQFLTFISNDFQIPQALALVWDITKSNIPSTDKYDLIIEFDNVFGLKLSETIEDMIPEEIIKIAEERLLARKNNDFKKSDELRDKIKTLGYIIEDSAGTYRLKKLF